MGATISAALQRGHTIRHEKNKTQHPEKTYGLKKLLQPALPLAKNTRRPFAALGIMLMRNTLLNYQKKTAPP